MELTKDAFGDQSSSFRTAGTLQRRVINSYSRFSGVSSTSNSVTGIDAMCPSSKEDFNEFEKLLKEKISQFEKSVHYSSFLESLFRELCISCKRGIFFVLFFDQQGFVINFCFLPVTVEVDDLKKVSNSLSVLLSEKQKQEKVSGFHFPPHTSSFEPPEGGAVYLMCILVKPAWQTET